MTGRLWRAESVSARLEPYRWEWADSNRALIDRDWDIRRAERSEMFNGRVLMASGLAQEGGHLRASFYETDYAAMMAWLGRGAPGAPVWNGFAMGALRCRDGGFLLGRMAAHTANAGWLYFPCGTPDLSDVVAGGTVDLDGSIRREITEETGLTPDSFRLEPGWAVAEEGGRLAFIRTGRLALTAAEAAERIAAHLAAEARPELAGIEILRRPEQIDDPAIPAVVALFLRDTFATSGSGQG